jgi:hypothetical protein
MKKASLHTLRSANLCQGILGVRTVHGFGSDWGDLEEDRLIGESPQRGSAQDTLGVPSTLKLCHLGHNRYLMLFKDESLKKLSKVSKANIHFNLPFMHTMVFCSFASRETLKEIAFLL